MKKTYKIGGMSCAACSARVERFVKKIPGINSAVVNLPLETLTVDYNVVSVNDDTIETAVTKAGYKIIKNSAAIISPEEHISQLRKRLALSLLLLFPLLLITMVPMLFSDILSPAIDPQNFPVGAALIEFILTIPIIILGQDIYKSGLRNLINLSPNMDSLIAIGTLSALLYSIFSLVMLLMGNIQYLHQLYFESAATILTLITFGKYLEARAKQKASDAVQSLLLLTPKTAHLEINGQETDVSVDNIKPGDIIIIRPGESLPVDGFIQEGTAVLNESMLTGESLPVTKEKDSPVFAGTINTTGYFKYKTSRSATESTVMQIVRLIEEAQSSKAPISRLADTVAGYFVPFVIAASCFAALFWLVMGESASFILTVFVSVMIVACPCSLGLATPTAIMVGSGKGAEYGILFKRGEILEALQKVNIIFFDKTGTLTTGSLSVTDIWSETIASDELLSLAAFAEQGSEHPIAKAICNAATEKGVSPQHPEEFISVPGSGVKASVFTATVHVGRLKWFKDINIIVPKVIEEKASFFANEGKSPIFISKNNCCLGVIALADTLKPETVSVIKELHTLGIDTVMLTGDNKQTAKKIAASAGIKQYHAEMLPAEKAAEIKLAQKNGLFTAMAGDGINDAPALTVSDIGIAIGSGTDIAIDSADLVLMRSDLRDILRAIRLSQQTMKIIRQNLFWAFAYNTLGIPIAMGILHLFGGPLLSPMLCAAAMSLSSVSVVTNALRLKNIKL